MCSCCCCGIISPAIHQLNSLQGLPDVLVPSDDDDMFKGDRFKKGSRRDPSIAAVSTRSTAATSSEDLLRDFLDEELKTFFPQRADAALFLKVLSADGVESWVVV